MTKIAILDDYTHDALSSADWDRLPHGCELTVFNDVLVEVEALAMRLAPFDVICIMRERTPFPAALFERLPALKLLVTSAMRNRAIDLDAARAQGVTVCGTGGSAWVTAEHTWALLLACARNIPHDDTVMRGGGWQSRIGVELRNRTIGLLGLGRIGAMVAHYAQAFGMKVTAWSQNLTAERCAEVGAELVSREDLFRRSDFVSIHVVLSTRTRGLVGRRELGLMRPDACLINTSRGPIVEEQALIDALENSTIRGAAVDVYDREPLPADHPYRRLDTLIMTPHTGYVTEETYRIFYSDMVEDICAWHAGDPVRVIT